MDKSDEKVSGPDRYIPTATQTEKCTVMQQQKLSNKAQTEATQLKGQMQVPAQQQLNTAK
jgi:hypothetical protein